MAMCSGCGCELAGIETLCHDCFEKQYAKPASGKKFSTPLLVFFIGGPALVLLMLFVPGVARVVDMARIVGNAFRFALAALGISIGIWESLKWRSTQNLAFWMLTAMNLAAIIMFLIQHDLRWYLPLILLFLLRKGMEAYHLRTTV